MKGLMEEFVIFVGPLRSGKIGIKGGDSAEWRGPIE